MTYRGQVKNGQIVLDQGARLRDGTLVEVTAMNDTAPDPAPGTAAASVETHATWTNGAVGAHAAPSQPDNLSAREAELLGQINAGLPGETWARYHELLRKRDDVTLTPAEQRDLVALSDEIEQANASRIALAAELARVRRVPLTTLLHDLGIPGGPRG